MFRYKDYIGQDLVVGDIILVASGNGQPTSQVLAKITALRMVKKFEPVHIPYGDPVPPAADPAMTQHHPAEGVTSYWDIIDIPQVQYRTVVVSEWTDRWRSASGYKLAWNTRKQSTEELKKIVKIDPALIQNDELKALLK
jgi:hypothetical protein